MPPASSTRSATTTETPPRRELRGVVERITFQNPENGITVARLAPERRDGESISSMDAERLITVVGTLPDLQPGEAIIAQGWWRNDPKHGWQFQAAKYRTTLPATVQGMKRYLGSGLVKGISPVNAGRIVDVFEETTFAIIDETPDRLTEVPGIGPVSCANAEGARSRKSVETTRSRLTMMPLDLWSCLTNALIPLPNLTYGAGVAVLSTTTSNSMGETPSNP